MNVKWFAQACWTLWYYLTLPGSPASFPPSHMFSTRLVECHSTLHSFIHLANIRQISKSSKNCTFGFQLKEKGIRKFWLERLNRHTMKSQIWPVTNHFNCDDNQKVITSAVICCWWCSIVPVSAQMRSNKLEEQISEKCWPCGHCMNDLQNNYMKKQVF